MTTDLVAGSAGTRKDRSLFWWRQLPATSKKQERT
jgi:hypothetical protein